ncbi:Reverse transcriptase domain-containing protein [Aphis craccivora]|uniref:Reverse transcriptase domain-containing protein n=1 Tax=Aphis craccivora TaxID=307492 RepID=A0A6G0YHR0_APHCR|nr:Reverse transcriptase domain-containing protein [Aphis craccivora]
MALAHNDWFTTFSIQQADISATMLQESILDAIQRFVPLKSFQVYLNDISANGPDIPNLFSSSTYKQPSAALNPVLMNINIQQFSFLLSHLSIFIEEVSDALKALSNIHGVGPDDILASLLFKCHEKISRVTPNLKSGDPALATNYRSVSNLPFIDQHGFFPGRSTITSSLDFSCFIRDAFKDNSQVDAIFTDFSETFDSGDHNSLIYTLDKLGISFPILSWIRLYLVDIWQYVKLFNISSNKLSRRSGCLLCPPPDPLHWE